MSLFIPDAAGLQPVQIRCDFGRDGIWTETVDDKDDDQRRAVCGAECAGRTGSRRAFGRNGQISS